jgi:hypothetical protein
MCNDWRNPLCGISRLTKPFFRQDLKMLVDSELFSLRSKGIFPALHCQLSIDAQLQYTRPADSPTIVMRPNNVRRAPSELVGSREKKSRDHVGSISRPLARFPQGSRLVRSLEPRVAAV